jgi:hypothetical protein
VDQTITDVGELDADEMAVATPETQTQRDAL